jgi:CheY-like chemotaxis protein
MPDLTGFEVCQRLRSAPETRQTPVVFLTALHEMEDHMREPREFLPRSHLSAHGVWRIHEAG